MYIFFVMGVLLLFQGGRASQHSACCLRWWRHAGPLGTALGCDMESRFSNRLVGENSLSESVAVARSGRYGQVLRRHRALLVPLLQSGGLLSDHRDLGSCCDCWSTRGLEGGHRGREPELKQSATSLSSYRRAGSSRKPRWLYFAGTFGIDAELALAVSMPSACGRCCWALCRYCSCNGWKAARFTKRAGRE